VIERTDEEIMAKLRELWSDANAKAYSRDETFTVTRGKGHIDLRVANMYESPGLDFAKLVALSKFFDTMNVETESEFRYGGCETCDYGSEYGFVLRVRDGAPFADVTT